MQIDESKMNEAVTVSINAVDGTNVSETCRAVYTILITDTGENISMDVKMTGFVGYNELKALLIEARKMPERILETVKESLDEDEFANFEKEVVNIVMALSREVE